MIVSKVLRTKLGAVMERHIRGVKIHYEIIGEGYPLVILHALGTDHRSIKAWMEPVFAEQPGWQRIYIDLPAHGQSGIHDSIRTTGDILTILLEFIETILPDQKFAVVAKSFGGYVAQGIFGEKADWIEGLCLLAPALHQKIRTVPPRIILEKNLERLSELDEDVRTAIETLMVVQSQDNIESFLNELQPGRILANRNFLTSSWRTEGYFYSSAPLEQESSYAQPLLMMLGKQDSICGYADHLPLLELFPSGTLSILDRAGHLLEIEQRKLVQHLFAEWLCRVKAYADAT